MHCLFDAIGVRAGSSAIVLEHLIEAWFALDTGDALTVVAEDDPPFAIPSGVAIRSLNASSGLKRVHVRTLGIRTVCTQIGADVVLSGNPGTALIGTSRPRACIVHDLRHVFRPDQFSAVQRLGRRVAWGAGLRSADVLLCVSDRTRGDLQRQHPTFAAKAVTMHLGADHVDQWPHPEKPVVEYVLAFGHFANKNADKVIDAWIPFAREHPDLQLVLVGIPAVDRDAIVHRIARLGVSDSARAMPWLNDDDFRALFAGARLVVFPSDFEGFGLPAIEAMRLGVRLVVSSDAALGEITGGHAVVASDLSPYRLADAMNVALMRSDADVEAGRAYAGSFQWQRAARIARTALLARTGCR